MGYDRPQKITSNATFSNITQPSISSSLDVLSLFSFDTEEHTICTVTKFRLGSPSMINSWKKLLKDEANVRILFV